MKKLGLLLLLAVMSVSLTACNACEENALDKLGDTLSTIGKDGLEKEKVLAERKAKRAAKCAESKAGEMKKKMGF